MSDRNVESVIERITERADTGLKKYGVTTERTDLDFEAWLQHLQDELLDAAVYIARLRTETVDQAAYRKGAAEMRERAAKLIETRTVFADTTRRDLAAAIRALDIEKAAPAGEG